MPGSTPGRPARPSSERAGSTGSEFDIIARYFACAGASRDDVVLSIGDDAALLAVEPGARVVTRTITVNSCEDNHDNAAALATRVVEETRKSLEQTGASPRWATLALTLPGVDENWLQAFAAAFDNALRTNDIALVGGDTTQGPLAITLSFTGTSHGAHASGGKRTSHEKTGA